MNTHECLITDESQKKLIHSFLLENFNEYGLDLSDARQRVLSQALKDSISQQERYILQVIERAEDIREIHKKGDFHNNQKCTIHVVRSNGASLIYKPVSPAPLKFIDALLDLCSHGFMFERVKILSEWDDAYLCEYLVEDNPAEIDLEKYSYHFGALTLLAYIFKISDLHHENIISSGSTPVIVDAETLFYPEVEGLKPFSFQSSLLLPGEFSHNAPAQKYGVLIQRAFESGIRQFAQNLSKHESAVQELLKQFELIKTRVILKPTRYYQTLLKNSLHPLLLENQQNRLEYLAKCLDGNHPVTKLILENELKALAQLDVPYFYCYSGLLFNVDDTPISLSVRAFKDQSSLSEINKSTSMLIEYSYKLNKSCNFLK